VGKTPIKEVPNLQDEPHLASWLQAANLSIEGGEVFRRLHGGRPRGAAPSKGRRDIPRGTEAVPAPFKGGIISPKAETAVQGGGITVQYTS
jgi:hypothetical protein